jgi:hypothetical protein
MFKRSNQSESRSLIAKSSALFCLFFGFAFFSEESAAAGDLTGRFMAGSTAASVSGSLEDPVIVSLFRVIDDVVEVDAGSSQVFMEMPGAVREVKIRNGQFSSSVILARPNDSIQIRNLDQEAKLLNCYVGNELKQSVFLPQRGSFIRISQKTAAEKKTRWVDATSGRTVWIHETQSPWVNICSQTGEFRWQNIPEGTYRVTIEKRNQGLIDRTLIVSAETSPLFAFRLGANGLEWVDSELN